MPPRKEAVKKKQITNNKITKKRTHFRYTEEALSQALQAIRIDKKGIREACRQFDVPRTTVQDRLHGRITEKSRKVGPDPILGIEGENKIVDWIIELAKCGIPVKKEDLLETVTKLLKDIGKENRFPGGRPGQKWYKNFLRRHPEISVREPEAINKAREAVKENSIRQWFKDLELFLNERGLSNIMEDPERILNADETGVSLCPKTGKVLAPKGYKNVYTVKRGNEKDTVTVLIMMTSSGKICPPLVVFPYIRPPKAVVENMPEGWVIGKTETGWMRSDVFYEYIANDFNNWLTENNIKKPIILFVDGHKSHMSMPLSEFCDENDIILYALPANTTHIMQPADVSVFGPLKQEWKNTLRKWQSRPENLNKTVTKTNFCKVFEECLNKEMTQTIRNGFRKCGLFPFNVEAVDYTKCVKNFQEGRKKRSILSDDVTDRDFLGAQKVVALIKNNLITKGIDPDILSNEIELAKRFWQKNRRSTSKTPRTSTSKTPRTSTEVPKSRSSKSPKQLKAHTEINTETDGDNIVSCSLCDISIPDVGSYVSLSDISVLPISDLQFDVSNSSQIITLAEVHNEENQHDMALLPLQENDILNISTVEKLRNANNADEIHNQPLPPQNITNPKNTQNLNTNKENSMYISVNIDPFEKHLKFPVDTNLVETKKRSVSKFPSAISSKSWRDYYQLKGKEKQKKKEEMDRKKFERELKKVEQAAKKRTIVSKKKTIVNIKLNQTNEKEKTDTGDEANCAIIKDVYREEKEETKEANNTKTRVVTKGSIIRVNRRQNPLAQVHSLPRLRIFK